MSFLREEIRNKAMNELANSGSPPHIRVRITDIEEDDCDDHLYAHLRLIEDALNGEYGDGAVNLFINLSSIMVCAIAEEVLARGWDDSKFPKSRSMNHVVKRLSKHKG